MPNKIVAAVKKDLRKMSYAEVVETAQEAGVSDSCLWFWREGVTISPQFDNVVAVAEVLGYEIVMEAVHA